MTEQEYRVIDRISYSAIKDFVTKGRKYFHKRYVLKEKVEEEITQATKIGSAVDCLLLSPERFEERFIIADFDKAPTDKSKGRIFVDTLFKLRTENPQSDFMVLAQQAYNTAELTRPTFEAYMEKFIGSDLEAYFDLLVASEGKIVLTAQDSINVDKIVNTLKNGENTRDIFGGEGVSQLPVVFEWEGFELKGLLDRVKIDHKNKTIQGFDLKCVYDLEEFRYKYLKNLYYIQECIYTLALVKFRGENYPEYIIKDFKFVVADSINNMHPLVYNFKIRPESGGLTQGFTTEKGGKYKGLFELLTEINWHVQNDIWDMSKENYEKSGIIEVLI